MAQRFNSPLCLYFKNKAPSEAGESDDSLVENQQAGLLVKYYL